MSETPKKLVSHDLVGRLREAKRLKETAEHEEGYPLGWSWTERAAVEDLERLEELHENLDEGCDCGWEDYFSDDGDRIFSPMEMFAFDVRPEECRGSRMEAEIFLEEAFGDKNVSGGPGLLRGFTEGALAHYHAAMESLATEGV